jgi:hypothetical protein
MRTCPGSSLIRLHYLSKRDYRKDQGCYEVHESLEIVESLMGV